MSGARKCEGGEVEWLVHWAGGVERWKSDATSWQQLDRQTVLAVWESESEREDIQDKLVSASATEVTDLQNQLSALPQQGSSGIVGRWVQARIRGHWSNAEITDFSNSSSFFRLKFEQLVLGQADPDDGEYDLLNAEVDWCFTEAPPRHSQLIDSLVGEREARRTRHCKKITSTSVAVN